MRRGRAATPALAAALPCALAAALAGPAAATAAAEPLRFDPPPRVDAADAGGRALDLRRVAFGQRDLRMVLDVRTAGPWRVRALAGGRSVCLVLVARGRLCVAPGARGGAFLRFAPERLPSEAGAPGAPRTIPAVVTRRDARSLRAVFAPSAIGLPMGPVRWAVETRWPQGGDRAPDRGSHRALRELLVQPSCFGAAARDPLRPCRNPALRRVAFPAPVDALIWHNSPCRRLPGIPRGAAFAPCEFGVTDGDPGFDFVLIGDSHAMQWRPALQVVAEARGWRGVSVARPGCPFTIAIPRSPALPPGACARLHRRALAWLRAHPDVDTLFVSSWAEPGYGGGPEAYGAMLDRVPETVERIYVLRDIPARTVRAFDCVSRLRRRHRPLVGACTAPRAAVLKPDPAAAAASTRGPRARALDFTRFFCGPARCHPVVGGAYVYKDDDHMNAVFATSLGPYVLRALRAGI